MAFRLGPVASERGLCEIDIVLFRVIKSLVKNWEFLTRRKYTHYNSNKKANLSVIFVVQGIPNFLTRYLVTLNNTLSISPSLRPLDAGTLRNAKNMESLLAMNYMISRPCDTRSPLKLVSMGSFELVDYDSEDHFRSKMVNAVKLPIIHLL